MLDFLKIKKAEWIPDDILTDNSPIDPLTSSNITDQENIDLANRLADHLNTIIDYKNRMDSLDYLATQARSNFDNISFTTADQGLVNAIIAIGGVDGTVDFPLAVEAVNLVLEWIDKTSLEALTESM